MSRLFHLLLAASLILASANLARGQFNELASKIPSGSNMLVLVRPDQLKAGSPSGRKEIRTDSPLYAGALAFLAPDAKAVILAEQFDIEVMIPLQSSSLVALDYKASLVEIGRRAGGEPDRIGNKSALALPGDSYLIQFAPNLVGAMAPANRQAVVRWLREIESSRNTIAPYLSGVLEKSEKSTAALTFAIDLEGAVTAHQVTQVLKSLPERRSAAEIAAIAPILADVRGATLTLDVDGEEFRGKLAIELGSELAFPAEAGKKLMLETMASRGATINELEDWSASVAGRQFILEGTLSASGIQRLSSIVNRPPALPRESTAAAPAEKDESARSVEASRKYWQRVQELLVDLKREPKRSSGYTLGQVALWMDSYARRIDQTSVAYVDQDLATWGANVADSLRRASYAIKSANAQSRVKEMNTPMEYDYYPWTQLYGYTYRWDYFGSGYVPYGNWGVDVYPNATAYFRARSRARREEKIAGASQANAIMDEVAKSGAEIRNKMEQKYNAQF